MTENTNKIFKAIHNVLKHLTVAKNGTLPGNLGGKPYQTAEDISNEVKNQLVKNNVIVEASEDVVKVESPDYGDKKMRFMITVQGSYRLIHIEDGSSLTIKGIGQGLGTGVATAASVASTFALKSALLRTFLISESGVEQDGNTEQAPPKQNSAQQQAAKATEGDYARTAKATPAAPKKLTGANGEAQKRVAAKMEDGTYDRERVTALNAKIAQSLGKSKGDVMVELEKALEAGEVA